MTGLRVKDDRDDETVSVTLGDRVLQAFCYGPDEQDRDTAMLKAQWYREGYGDALDHFNDDPAPADPESIAAREHADAEGLTAAGRGHLNVRGF